jgi:hypothetical protein
VLTIPDEILKPFDAVMEEKPIPLVLRPNYRKWLRYYLDFRDKYPPPDSKSEQVRLFIDKLRSKNQPQNMLNQAAHALSLLFEAQSRKNREPGSKETKSVLARPIPIEPQLDEIAPFSRATQKKTKTAPQFGRRYDEMRFREKTQSPE